MKAVALIVALAAVAVGPAWAAATGAALRGGAQDRKITEVVKLLQKQLELAKAEGDTERELFAKYKCYCDTNEASKTSEIQRLSQEISILEAKIEELTATNGQLSKEVAQLDADMIQNRQDREEAAALRTKEREEFVAKEADLVNAIQQMVQAIETLSQIGADQSLNSAADHAQYMAGHSLLKLKASIKTALVAASSFVSQKQAEHLQSFLQAPFTGTYSARSGEVVGILKDMHDTFVANLKAAREVESRAQEAYDKFKAEKERAHTEMMASYQDKQGQLAGNDADLSAKRSQKDAAQTMLAEAQDFLAKLVEMCSAKAKQYDERVALRSEEEAALSEAIAILNSDAAFATFGKVSATSTGALQFVQKRSTIRRHRQQPAASALELRQQAAGFLQAAARDKGASPLLGRILAMLQANNPFQTVLEEIQKMLVIIEKEGQADAEQKAYCDEERQETNDGISAATDKVQGLETMLGELDATINDPSTGLIVQLKNTEEALQENVENQASETKSRKEENDAYQKDIANLVEAGELISRAVQVLKAYYSKIVAGGFVQVKRDDPAPPTTWEDTFKGQSEGSNDAVSMLEFIVANTKKEEEQAHSDEAFAQHDYEDSMQSLKDAEAMLGESLANLHLDLASAQEDLLLKRNDLEKTEAEKAALEAYLLKLKPGCDFIDANLDSRIDSRTKEAEALQQAVMSLKGSSAYKTAMEAQHQEDLGACRQICSKSEDHVDCKACLADTTVPGYCAGHPATHGCE